MRTARKIQSSLSRSGVLFELGPGMRYVELADPQSNLRDAISLAGTSTDGSQPIFGSSLFENSIDLGPDGGAGA